MGGYQRQYSNASSGSLYNQVRQAINMGDISRAEELLRSAPSQDAEWHFLTGSIAYRKGWLDEATQHFQMACNMDPSNGEYRQALMMMRRGTGLPPVRLRRRGGHLRPLHHLSVPQLPVRRLRN